VFTKAHIIAAKEKDSLMLASIQSKADHDQTHHTLNLLMRNELAAVDAYGFAIVSGRAHPEYNYCMNSHQQRAAQLAEYMTVSGNTSVCENDLEGPFHHLLNHESCSTYRTKLINTLKNGEADILRRYQSLVSQVDSDTLNLLNHDLMPQQIQTYNQMSLLFESSPRSFSFLSHWF
jgi:hypothetical protein